MKTKNKIIGLGIFMVVMGFYLVLAGYVLKSWVMFFEISNIVGPISIIIGTIIVFIAFTR